MLLGLVGEEAVAGAVTDGVVGAVGAVGAVAGVLDPNVPVGDVAG